MAADPKTGLTKAKSARKSRRTATVGLVVLAPYFAGRWAADRDHD